MLEVEAPSESWQPGERAYCAHCGRAHGAWILLPGDVVQCQYCSSKQNRDVIAEQAAHHKSEAEALQRNIVRFRQRTSVEAARLEERKRRIRASDQGVADGLLEGGRELAAAKAECKHGEWADFCADVGRTTETANNQIRMAEFIDSHPERARLMRELAPTLIYSLARKGTPQHAIEEITRLLEAGQKVTTQEGQAIIAETKKALAFIEAHAPEPLKQRVTAGTLAPQQAVEMTKVLAELPAPVADALLTHNVTDPAAALEIAKRANTATGKTALETGVLQGGGTGIPLNTANVRDIQAVFGEASYFHRLENSPDRVADVRCVVDQVFYDEVFLRLDRKSAALVMQAFNDGHRSCRLIIDKGEVK